MAVTPSDSTAYRPGLIRDLAAQLRVHHWVKNVLVLISPLAAHALFDPEVLRNVALIFVAFCAAASGVYVVNDLIDIRTDRAHPRKRNRPLAGGRLTVAWGLIVGPLLMIVGMATAFYISVQTGGVLVVYVVLSMAYSMYLKTQPLVDVFTLSLLYTLRVFAGEHRD